MAMVDNMYKEKAEKMDRVEFLKICIMIGAVIPTLVATYTLPGLDKYFKTAASQDIIATAEAAKNWLGLMIIIFSCNLKGIKFFVKVFPLLVITDIVFATTIALLGPEQIELRFYGHVFCNVIMIGGIGQATNHYVMRLWEKEELQLICNKINMFGTIGGLVGSSITCVYNPFTVNELLWLNVIVAVLCGVFRSAVFYGIKKEVERLGK